MTVPQPVASSTEQDLPSTGPVLEDPPSDVTEADRPQARYTDDDLARVRREEKSKLYDELEKLRQETAQLMQEKQEREQAAAEEAKRVAEEQRKRQEEEMSVRELLQKKEQEWQQQLEMERHERERALAALDKERQYLAVQQYRTQMIEANRDNILPELIDLVGGENKEQIDASINGLVERSSRILQSTQQAAQTVRREQPGARVTAPPSEPLDAYSGNQSFTPDQIRDMSIEEYAQYRDSLLGGGTTSQGMFG